MRFRSKTQPRGLLRSQDQRRLTLAIAGIGLLVVLISIFWRSAARPTVAGSVDVNPDFQSREVTETLLGSDTLRSDEFLVVPPQSTPDTAPLDLKALLDPAEASRLDSLTGRQPRTPVVAADDVVPKELLRPVRDDMIGVHSQEAEAYFAALRLAGSLKQNAPGALQPARYALFMDSPEFCRGQAYQVTGTLRRLTRVQDEANSFGLKTLYDAWISLPDSGAQLVHVVSVTADAGLPLTESIHSDPPLVQFPAFFFKREGYVRAGTEFEGDVGLTPLLLAGRIRRYQPTDVTESAAEALTPWLGWLTLIVAGGISAIIWQFQISDRIFRRSRTHQLTQLPVRVSFDGIHAITVSESLQQMESRGSP